MMNIGIIVYSLSDHTLTAATRLKEKLTAGGHEVTLERVETVGPAKPQFENAELKTKPPVDAYDAVVFACPVRGGTVPPPMKRYLEQIPSLQGKQVACLVTHFFFPTRVGGQPGARGAADALRIQGRDRPWRGRCALVQPASQGADRAGGGGVEPVVLS